MMILGPVGLGFMVQVSHPLQLTGLAAVRGLQLQRGLQVRPKTLLKLGLSSIFGSRVNFFGSVTI